MHGHGWYLGCTHIYRNGGRERQLYDLYEGHLSTDMDFLFICIPDVQIVLGNERQYTTDYVNKSDMNIYTDMNE